MTVFIKDEKLDVIMELIDLFKINNEPHNLINRHKIANLINDYAVKAYLLGEASVKREIVGKIIQIKIATRSQTGAFKYDACYDECIEAINNIKRE